MRQLISIVPAAAGVLSLVFPASATVYEFRFGGTIAAAERTGNTVLAPVQLNDPWSLAFRFEHPQPDQEPSDSTLGVYAMTPVTLNVGAISLNAAPGFMLVLDEHNLGSLIVDGFLAGGSVAPDLSMDLRLFGPEGPGPHPTFTSDALPTSLDLATLPIRQLVLLGPSPDVAYVSGTVNWFEAVIVPAPAGATVLLTTLAVLHRRQRPAPPTP